MKKTIATLMILAGLLAWSVTQAEMDSQNHLQRMKSELNLTDQQEQEVRKIFEETRPQLEALRQQRREIHEKMKERLKGVLTAEQMQKFEQIHEERKAQRKMHRQHQRP